MLFSSLSFIFRFLPVFLIIYYIVPAKVKNLVLFIGSLVFYGLGEPSYVVLILLSVIVNYLCALVIDKSGSNRALRLLMMVACAIYDIGALVFFKYGQFIADSLSDAFDTPVDIPEYALPLGISFYTFQILSYVIDVYRNEVECEKNIIDLGAYLCMFPQLIAGPIVIYRDINQRLKLCANRVSFRQIENGIIIFVLGLGSKVLLANRFGQIWDSLSEIGYGNVSFATAWIGVIAYTFQIYFDFNGYSLMAIGLGRMLGFEFPRNFNSPYIACSVTDFWKRWHISLTDFFRNYLYIPLGGNRHGAFRMYFNMLIVWLVTGFWHGANWNFVIWGLYYFVFLFVERLLFGHESKLTVKLDKLKSSKVAAIIMNAAAHLYTLIVVVVGWAIFAVEDLEELGLFLQRLFAPFTSQDLAGMELSGFGGVMYIWIIIGAVLSTPIFIDVFEKRKKSLAGTLLLLLVFWASVVQLTESVYNPFLYFRF